MPLQEIFTDDPESMREWDATQSAKQASFVQSSTWAVFQKSLGHKVRLYKDEGWTCLIIERPTRLGKYWFAPYGPTASNQKTLMEAVQILRVEARKHSALWLRVEPRGDQGISLNRPDGVRESPRYVHPADTVMNDLQDDEDVIFKKLSSTNRNLVNRSKREGVSFKTSYDPADIEIFLDMQDTVTARNKVNFHPKEYMRKQAQVMMPSKFMSLEMVIKDNKPYAAAIIQHYGEVAYYTHAASFPEARKLELGTVLVWHCMARAKELGYKYFDFWGVAPEGADRSHPWFGLSQFKHKFGGKRVCYVGTWDIVLSKKYLVYLVAYRLNRLRIKLLTK